jgi:outer membrane protein assembly factor BamD (BamD/ComL family)
VVEHFPGSPDIIEALVILVKCYRIMHLYDLADNTMKILVTNYPNLPEVQRLEKGYNN